MRKSKLLHPAPLGIRHHSFRSLFRRPRPHLSIPFAQETQKLQEQQPTRIALHQVWTTMPAFLPLCSGDLEKTLLLEMSVPDKMLSRVLVRILYVKTGTY